MQPKMHSLINEYFIWISLVGDKRRKNEIDKEYRKPKKIMSKNWETANARRAIDYDDTLGLRKYINNGILS